MTGDFGDGESFSHCRVARCLLLPYFRVVGDCHDSMEALISPRGLPDVLLTWHSLTHHVFLSSV